MASLRDLLYYLSPSEAEAKVVPAGPDEKAMLAYIAQQNLKQRGQYLPDMQRRIMERAQANPATVTVLEDRTLGQSATAAYDPAINEVRYDPGLPAVDLPNTIAHEMLHFLNQQSSRPQGVSAQHALIQLLLGTNRYRPTSELKGYQPPAITEKDQEIIRSWMGGR